MVRQDINLGDTVACNRGDLVTSVLDEETVMMSIERGKYYGLDPVGSRIWELLQTPRRVSAIVNGVLEEFTGERGAVERDLLAFLNKLAGEGMLTIGAAPP